MRRFALLLLLAAVSFSVGAQRLQPGFDKAEYLELLHVNVRLSAAAGRMYADVAPPRQFRRAYRSPVLGLDNRWELWHNGRGVAVVSIRGTTASTESWLANFYAAMLPAKGELRLSKQQTFRYELAQNPRAAVHAGWLLGLAAQAEGILARLDSCYRRGTKDVIITGHSQGGAIAFLLTAHLRRLQQQGRLPADLRLKTYCSAAPKPGNQYFAYEYEAQTQSPRGSWSVNVVSAADWVPETPVSVQTFDDFNQPNPFTGSRRLLRRQALPVRVVFAYALSRLEKPTRRAQRRYRRYLGTLLEGQIRKHWPEYRPGPYFPSNNYARVGPTVVLLPDAAYYQQFPDNPQQVFTHHLFQPYLYLAERLWR
jgi:pimeloyl-ACP methyl ester carboxylesterase